MSNASVFRVGAKPLLLARNDGPPRPAPLLIIWSSYQRTCSVFRGTCYEGRSRGTVHLTVGHAGATWYDNGAEVQPSWIEHEAQLSHGYARLHVNATHFHVEVRLVFLKGRGVQGVLE